MLQVPCLSPPIYGHSHYKKFWLRQTEIGGSSSGSSCVEVMNSSDSSQKKICGKRRQNLRCPSSPIKVSLNESSVCASPSSSEELLNHSPLSAVENREDDHEFDEQKIVREEEEEAAVLDCLKCNSDSRPDSFSDSDSATSSTSQATDHEGEDQKSSPLRQFLKRKAKAEGLVLNSPKTRSSQGTITDIHLPVSPGNASRTCKHCGTMKTPLWRNGPLGPKSLCNACGIRLRKARRNNQEAGSNGQATVLSTKRKMSPQVEGTAVVTYKKSKVGLKMSILQQTQEDIPKKVLGRSLSKDEEEGAVLLMALSYGLVLA